jgi:hypothetical protein
MAKKGPVPTPLLQRITRRVVRDTQSGCWNWQGRTNGRYGYTTDKPNGRHSISCHRAIYEIYFGEIPDGMVVDHKCDNPICCNPSHLQAVPQSENLRYSNSLAGKNARKTHCIHGHRLSGNNLHILKTGARKCRACDAERQRNRRLKAQEVENV